MERYTDKKVFGNEKKVSILISIKQFLIQFNICKLILTTFTTFLMNLKKMKQ